MTFEIIAAVLACIAAAIAVWGAIDGRRTVVRLRAGRRWTSGTVCRGYQLPATQEDSGLCGHCGMYDYKHSEESGA